MRALRFAAFGDRDVLEVAEVDAPAPGPREVAVRVRAAGVNRLDLQIREGSAGFPIPLPFIGGMEAVGEVAALGSEVEGWGVGERVMRDVTDSCGRCRHCRSGCEWRCESHALTLNSVSGGFGEVLVCDARRLIRLPAEIDDATAAAIQMSYGTAWQMLFARAGLQAGERVLISSVGSALGSAALDIAKLAGAFVIGTASSEEKLARARARGLDVGIEHSAVDVATAVRDATGGEGVDVAFEHVGGDAFAAALASLAMDGRLVTCGWHGGGTVELDLMSLIRERRQIVGSVNRTRDDLHRCIELVAAGRLSPAIAASFPLEQARDAVGLIESRAAFGKVVLEL
ncbi:MAG TPA: zinc-binding dehydrogenase [Solirubrobacteraceae bacterium]|nr:zinc-binding dehydrogenase [Solirubrobacteraceae bacterium]